MPAERIMPDKTTLKRWWEDEGLSRQQIVDRIAETRPDGRTVTKQAVSMAVANYGLKSKRNRWDELLPWRVVRRHADLKEAVLLRKLGRRKAGLKNSAEFDRWVDGWLQELQEKGRPVVTYYADSPNGFYYVPRVPEDGDGEYDVIRRPEVQVSLDRREA